MKKEYQKKDYIRDLDPSIKNTFESNNESAFEFLRGELETWRDTRVKNQKPWEKGLR